ERQMTEHIYEMDDIETYMKIKCAPLSWTIGMGKAFKGVYILITDTIHVFTPGQGSVVPDDIQIQGLQSPEAAALLGAELVAELTDEIELVQGASHEFDLAEYRRGELTPVFFGTALANFGVREMLDYFVEWAAAPLPRETDACPVPPTEENFRGCLLNIQANMERKHRDRIALMRICSGDYTKGMKLQ